MVTLSYRVILTIVQIYPELRRDGSGLGEGSQSAKARKKGGRIRAWQGWSKYNQNMKGTLYILLSKQVEFNTGRPKIKEKTLYILLSKQVRSKQGALK